jgi:hypothetical protein
MQWKHSIKNLLFDNNLKWGNIVMHERLVILVEKD